MDKLHIVTVATDSKYYFPYLVDSCKKNGKELEVLGMGEKWEGFNWKFKKMIDYLNTLPKDDIVCFVDGYDVLCTRKLNELIPAFKKIRHREKCKMIVGYAIYTTLLYNIYNDIINTLHFGKCNNKSLNSGTYIGYVSDILIILKNIRIMNSNNLSDDQQLLTTYCSKNRKEIYIDDKSELFLTSESPLGQIDNYITLKNKQVMYNNKYPFFIHAAGSGFLNKVLLELGYNYNGNIEENLKLDFYTVKVPRFINEILHTLSINFILIFILFIFILLCTYKVLYKPSMRIIKKYLK